MNSKIISLALIVAGTFLVSAADTKPTKGKEKWSLPVSLLNADAHPDQREWRKAYANALLEDVEALYYAVPDLTPGQQDWLAKTREREEKSKDRSVQSQAELDLVSSKEFALERVKSLLDRLVTNLRSVATNDTAEFYRWAAVSHALTYAHTFGYLDWLENEGYVALPKENRFRLGKKGDAEIWKFETCSTGREILKKIVMPVLLDLEIKVGIIEDGPTNRPKPAQTPSPQKPSPAKKQEKP